MGRNLIFSAIILVIEIPLGIFIALNMPKKGWGVPVCLVLMALPLLIPWNVVGTIWQVFGRVDIGLLGYSLSALGFDYNYVNDPFDAWITVIVMDVWHWTSLVVLLCYAGLVSIPDAYYQAAKIDGASRWAIFRYIQLPKMNRVLLIAVLLRFMDSFMIYTEPFVVTGGGPGNTTTFLSIDLVKLAIGEFDLGDGGGHVDHLLPDRHAAVLGVLHRHDQPTMRSSEMARLEETTANGRTLMRQTPATAEAQTAQRRAGAQDAAARRGVAVLVAGADDLHHLPDAADLLAGQHELQDQPGDPRRLLAVAEKPDARQLRGDLHRSVLVQGLHQLDHLCGYEHGDFRRRGAAGGLCLLALPLPRRQAPVLLAADQPHGAAGGVRAAVLPALFGFRPDRHAHRRGAGALPVQRAAGGLDPRRLHVGRAEGDRRDRLYRRLFLPALLPEDIHAADRERHRRRRPSSASCSRGSNC